MPRSILLILALLALSACSGTRGRVVVASGEPAPAKAPPHPVYGPVASLGVPPGHYPRPGECRVWLPGRPPGHQPAACSCSALVGAVPPGAWVLYRPAGENVLEVTAYAEKSATVVASVSWYDLKSGELIRATKGGKGPSKHGKSKGKGKHKHDDDDD